MTKPTRHEEMKLYKAGYEKIAGVDEAGRGAWAGPLVAAAVILPRTFRLAGLNDSKKVSAPRREVLYEKIVEKSIAWHAQIISRQQIDRHGVGRANRLAIIRCVQKLSQKPDYVLVDGFTVSWRDLPAKGIVKGDAKVVAIAAASIIAKVTRDRLMRGYHRQYPQYHFHQHKGYGTATHLKMICQHGLCPQHRRSFKPIKRFVKRLPDYGLVL